MTQNRTLRLKSRPHGLVQAHNFDIVDEPCATPGPGEFQVKLRYISLDPAMRGWMNEARSYVRPVGIGEVMRAYGAGTVTISNHPDFHVGDEVTGVLGVQHYAVSDGRGVNKVDTSAAPLARWVGGLGMPGLTAYFGLLRLGEPKAGDTLVVSGAAGAVGSMVGQIGKIHGCRVVGIAGGPAKGKYVVDTLGFDACVDYKNGDLKGQLKKACPDGVDIYFDNVGGEIFDLMLSRMNPFGRIPICGMISGYNATEMPPGPKNIVAVLVKRLRLQGFIVFDFLHEYQSATQALAAWYQDGKLHMEEDVRQGDVDQFVETLNRLYSGQKRGKLILELP